MQSKAWPFLLILTGLILIAQWGTPPLVGMETDLWWHLAAGRRIFEHGLELTDPFSFTYANRFWIRIDWAFQALVWPIYHYLGGIGALLAARALAFVAGAAALTVCLRRQQVGWGRCWLCVLLTASIWAQAAGIRPGTVSMLFTAVWVLLLEEARRGQTRRLWLLPPLMLLWYNLHVAALAGLLILGLYSAGQTLDWLVWRQPRPRRLWWGIIPLTLMATLVTPQPGLLLFYPIQFLLRKTPWMQHILEVQPSAWNMAGTAECRLLLGLACLGALEMLRRRQCTGLLLCLVCGYLVNATYRHQFQLCSVFTPLAGLALQQATVPGLRWWRPILALLALGLGVRAALYLALARLPLEGLVRRESYPEVQVRWLASFPAELRVFTDMNTGGYYLFFFEGRQKVFLDSRTDQVYADHSFFAEYQDVLSGRPNALQLLERYQVQAVALQTLVSGGPQSPLDLQLRQDPRWGPPVYQDMIGRIYLRAGLPHPPPPAPPEYLRHFVESNYRESLADYPQFAYAQAALARLYLARNQPGAARRHLARAELLHPDRGSFDEDWRPLGWADQPWLRTLCLPFWAL